MHRTLGIFLIFVFLAAAGFAEAPPEFAETKKNADAGNAYAQHNLGLMYNNGDGVPKDYAEAIKWYRKAAEHGIAQSQHNIGLFYLQGEGVPKDYAETVKWFRKAAEQGHAQSQANLGVMYYNGNGVPKDLVQAHVWWNIAGANGNEDAKKNLANVEKEMTSEQKAEAMKLARELFAKLPKGK